MLSIFARARVPRKKIALLHGGLRLWFGQRKGAELKSLEKKMAKKGKRRRRRKGVRIVFRPWITTRDGRRIYAAWYGLSAFPIEVDDD